MTRRISFWTGLLLCLFSLAHLSTYACRLLWARGEAELGAELVSPMPTWVAYAFGCCLLLHVGSRLGSAQAREREAEGLGGRVPLGLLESGFGIFGLAFVIQHVYRFARPRLLGSLEPHRVLGSLFAQLSSAAGGVPLELTLYVFGTLAAGVYWVLWLRRLPAQSFLIGPLGAASVWCLGFAISLCTLAAAGALICAANGSLVPW